MNISSKYYICTLSRHVSQTQFELFCVYEKKEVRSLGNFSYILAIFRQNALLYCYSLSIIAYFQQIFSVKLAYRILLDWMPLYYIADTKFPHHDHKFHRVPVFYCKQMVARKWSIHSNVLGS